MQEDSRFVKCLSAGCLLQHLIRWPPTEAPAESCQRLPHADRAVRRREAPPPDLRLARGLAESRLDLLFKKSGKEQQRIPTGPGERRRFVGRSAQRRIK